MKHVFSFLGAIVIGLPFVLLFFCNELEQFGWQFIEQQWLTIFVSSWLAGTVLSAVVHYRKIIWNSL